MRPAVGEQRQTEENYSIDDGADERPALSLTDVKTNSLTAEADLIKDGQDIELRAYFVRNVQLNVCHVQDIAQLGNQRTCDHFQLRVHREEHMYGILIRITYLSQRTR